MKLCLALGLKTLEQIGFGGEINSPYSISWRDQADLSPMFIVEE
jgi:hypothetical protein